MRIIRSVHEISPSQHVAASAAIFAVLFVMAFFFCAEFHADVRGLRDGPVFTTGGAPAAAEVVKDSDVPPPVEIERVAYADTTTPIDPEPPSYEQFHDAKLAFMIAGMDPTIEPALSGPGRFRRFSVMVQGAVDSWRGADAEVSSAADGVLCRKLEHGNAVTLPYPADGRIQRPQAGKLERVRTVFGRDGAGVPFVREVRASYGDSPELDAALDRFAEADLNVYRAVAEAVRNLKESP